MTSPSTSPSTQAPAIRTFQMDSSADGNPANAVNLFRGDVNLTQTLFTLAGRSQDDPLQVSVALQYQSNVARAAGTWNADAPTGPLGLGWSLPVTYIAATPGQSPVATTRQYALYQSGVPNQLVRQPIVPLLLSVDGTVATQLVDGQTVPEVVCEALASHGHRLSSAATVVGSGPWSVRDDANMQLLDLQLVGSQLEIRDGGELYQLQNYQFSKIVYYPAYERWLVVGASGIRRSFGGRAPDHGQCAAAVANSIVWSVWSTNASGRPIAISSGIETDDQVQVATAWYLTEASDRFGGAIRCRYNDWPRDPNGVVPVVEQQVGEGGRPYTKAIYLSEIVDALGRVVRFNYAEKLWSAAPESPREYADPHRAEPSSAPGPYQDRYETYYLREITVSSSTAAVMFSFEFNYAVANVTGNTGSLRGDTYKRLLTSIVQRNADGVALPSMRFEYDLAPDNPHGQPGALLAVTSPQGSITRYQYTRHALDLCDRTATIERPSQLAAGASPRVFFGTDYSVVTYYQPDSAKLSLQIFTWVGSWLSWQLDPDSPVIDTKGLDIETLEVLAADDFVALTFARSQGGRAVYVLQRDTARPGQWQPATIGEVTTACDVPTLSYVGQASFAGGASFFVVAQMDVDHMRGSYDRLTWRWTRQCWTRETTTTSSYAWVTAGAEYYAVLDATGALTLQALDGEQAWSCVATTSLAGLNHSDVDNVVLVPGAALLVIANLQSGNSQQNTYALTIVEWDDQYAIGTSAFGPFTDGFGDRGQPLSWVPQIVSDTMIGANGNLIRRAGGGWSVNTALNLGENPPARTAQRYAYGTDHAIQVIDPLDGAGAPTASVVAYDPTRENPWVGPTNIGATLPSDRANYPSVAGGDWAVIGPFVYCRGTATDWTDVFAGSPLADLRELAGQAFVSESLVNEGPGFLAYSVGAPDQSSAQAVVLHNGALAPAPTRLDDERIYVPSEGGRPGPGISPQGPSTFVTFPAADSRFDVAQTVLLHRYAGEAIEGPITHYTVTFAELDDGLSGPVPTAFEPELDTAGCDPSGDIVKFYQTTVYPGARSSGEATQGKVVSRYHNGIVRAQPGVDDFDMLDGMLISTTTYAQDQAEPVEATSTSWAVVQQVASSPTDPDAPPIQLRGGWVTQSRQQQLRDGVTTTTDTEFVTPDLRLPYTGKPTVQRRAQTNASGELETFQRTTRYGVEFDSALVAIHALADVALVTDVRVVGARTTVLSSTATSFSSWATAIDPRVVAPAPEAQFGLLSSDDPAFPFADYQPGTTPAGWQLVSRVDARGRYGLEREVTDGRGVATATLLGVDERLAVATVINATTLGCAYLGFQPYEDSRGWTLDQVELDPQLAFAGTQSARLPGGASISVAVSPGDTPTYVIGYRYRTASGFGGGGGVRACVTVDGVEQPAVSQAWTDTARAWTYATLAVPIPVGSQRSLAVEVRNVADLDVHVDSILIVPLPSGATVQTFDPDSLQVLASMDASGRTSRTAYDRNQQPTVSVGVAGRVRELTLEFASRLGNVGDRFDPTSPNAQLILDAAAGGVLEQFRDGGGWATRWAPSDPNAWVAIDGALEHRSASPGSIVWQAEPGADSWALYFEIEHTDATPSVTVGDIRIAWTGSGYLGAQAGASWTALATPPNLAQRWLLVIGDGVVLFFADGQLLFAEKTAPAAGSLAITAAEITLRNLTVVEQVRLGSTYLDGASRQRQLHQLHGADSYVRELVYDPLGRQLATTKCAPGSFGAGASVPVMGFRRSFVDLPAFVAATASSWRMTGDVADYHADDAGYPYWGTRYEASPRSQRIELGQPGQPDAINLELEPARRRTLMFEFGPNPGPDLAAGQFNQTRVTSAIKGRGIRDTDRFGQAVAGSWQSASGELISQAEGLRSYDDPSSGATTTLEVRLPNALIPGPQSGDNGYTSTSITNPLQQTVAMSDADTGETRFVFDSAGNLRFVQPALDDGEAWFIYSKYDALSRVVEQGTVEGSWDPDELAQLADQPSYPSDGRPTTTTAYDGDGGEPSLIGMKWRATSSNRAPDQAPDAGECSVVETFAYDEGGNVESVAQTLAGAVTAAATIGYASNTLGEVVRVDLPDGAPIRAICYARDDQGQVIAIGTNPGAEDLGGFDYDPDGQVCTQRYGGGAWQRSFDYASTGWVLGSQTRTTSGQQCLTLSMEYEADGQMRSRTVESEFQESSSYADRFSYDDLRRLTAAEGSSAVSYPRYDGNGNLWTAIEAGQTSTFECAPGSNRPRTVTIADGDPQVLDYNARGQLRAGLGRRLSYERSTAMTTAIASGDNHIRLGYGSSQQRVLKQIIAGAGEQRIYFSGAGLVPIATLVGDQWAIDVQGPTGLLARVSDRAYFPLTDTTGSIWAVVDDTSLVGASSYRPFGELSGTTGSPERIPYRYQGQEWDGEVQLYNFRARIYDPVLRRFVSPDPRRQFFSPYVFAADAPLTAVDPTGESATWAVYLGLAALTVAGVALTLVTAGASDALLLAVDSSVLAGEVASGVAVEAGVEAAAGATVGSVAGGLAGSAAMTAGFNGICYEHAQGGDITAGGMFKTLGIGAAQGLATGLVGGMLGPLADAANARVAESSVSAFAKAAGRAASGTIAGVVGRDLQQVLTNISSQQPWYQGLLRSSGTGAMSGAMSGGGGSLAGSAWGEVKPVVMNPGPTWTAITDSLASRYTTILNRSASAVPSAFSNASPYWVFSSR
ncbi:RHS repeat-associated core domain-containing protein [Enhygromyxa salina]|uniref:tRNA(Glu)-specific nuclease WapA n=1 Tax=Enhygromyxa salina TaxID=215803 RepID=A0A2S9YXA2_9BACT|nr:RHS repeat-associated core domain-containing protein [Enhygromyxa salina]PRQ09707.1 tRNA(Glu)-specific nuclease WapA precursor [Enhygromyxa salina]